MRSTARGGLPNSTIDASRSGSADSLPLPPTRSVSSMPGTKKISCTKPLPSTILRKLSIRLLPERSGINSTVRSGDIDEAGIAAARRGIDAAVGAGSGEHAERRHRDEFLRMDVDLRSRLRDHARRGLRVDRGEVAGGKIGQGATPLWFPRRLSASHAAVISIRSEPRPPAAVELMRCEISASRAAWKAISVRRCSRPA